MIVWFTADLHLRHARVAELRGYLDIDQHDRALAEAWDEQVHKNDQVWVLGDVTLSAIDYALDWLGDRPGARHLITGNHDHCHPMHRDSHNWQRRYLRLLPGGRHAVRADLPARLGGIYRPADG